MTDDNPRSSEQEALDIPLRDVADQVNRIIKGAIGKGSSRAHAFVGHDVLVVVLRDTFTVQEQTIVDRGGAVTVRSYRQALDDSLRDDLIGAVEEITGHPVIDYGSQTLARSQTTVEIFLLG